MTNAIYLYRLPLDLLTPSTIRHYFIIYYLSQWLRFSVLFVMLVYLPLMRLGVGNVARQLLPRHKCVTQTQIHLSTSLMHINLTTSIASPERLLWTSSSIAHHTPDCRWLQTTQAWILLCLIRFFQIFGSMRCFKKSGAWSIDYRACIHAISVNLKKYCTHTLYTRLNARQASL